MHGQASIHFHKLLIPLFLLTICGCSSGGPNAASASGLAVPAGNWQMEAQDVPAPANPNLSYLLIGALSVQGTTVYGNFRILPALLPTLATPCVQPLQVIPFTGMVDSSNLLTLTSAQFSGSTATLQLQLPLINNIAHGTAQIASGACATPSIPMVGVYVPPVTGSYAGTLNPVVFSSFPPNTNTSGAAVLSVSQSTPTADGQFPVTATLSFNSTSCLMAATPLTGTISGLSLKLTGPITGSSTFPLATVHAGAASVGNASFLNISLDVSGSSPACSGGLYSGNLNRQ